MQFLVINTRKTEGVDMAEFNAKVGGEVAKVKEFYADGFVRTIWHRGGDTPGGILIVEADDETDVRNRLSALPLVEAGIVEVSNVIPLKPFAGFAM
jgi:muconolactone delta-isomerase